MTNFAKSVVAVRVFLGLMIVMLMLLGLSGSGGGPLGWAVSLLAGAAWWVFTDWVYKTKVGKKPRS